MTVNTSENQVAVSVNFESISYKNVQRSKKGLQMAVEIYVIITIHILLCCQTSILQRDDVEYQVIWKSDCAQVLAQYRPITNAAVPVHHLSSKLDQKCGKIYICTHVHCVSKKLTPLNSL